MAEYEIIKSERKTLCIEITRDARVVIRVPYLASKDTVNNFIASHESWIKKHLSETEQRQSRNPAPTKQELEALKQQAKAYIPHRVAELAAKTGLSYTGVKITTAATRFGSCSPKNSLCFSCLLMRYPKPAIDYVIIHELCHTVHHNHQKPFWKLVQKFMPDYKYNKSLLK